MKSLPASLILVATAITQSLGIFQYTSDAMVLSGQVFFPILFALMAFYLVWRNPETANRFAGPHILILGLAVIALVATIAGNVATIYWLYPQVYIYYAVFALMVLELGLRIAALPKKEKKEKKEGRLSKRQQRRNRGTNLVATVKQDGAASAPADQAASEGK